MKHNFQTSLKIGQAGEKRLLDLWPDLVPLDGRKSDFYLQSTGELVEVKSDSYDHDKTTNFFIELMRDMAKGKVGGPAQALEHGSSLWVYWFPKNKIAYIFDTATLVSWLKLNYHKYEQRDIYNISWVTVGLIVPRTELSALYTVRNLNDIPS